ncbi:DUF2804 domain-containing protein [Desulfoluna spongiiphila]|uniref:DUF2804 domain-containing protein n=1 Tax=Desulfoluna spongiiphila TaxID=419481 RepID=A0A1G5F2R2_9BACT|nr:DUF2804 domain-containing protein [Desulfoluna spongiiphila]SCY33546.1 Protein of unknown function [Desulfoluna spongiiphila]
MDTLIRDDGTLPYGYHHNPVGELNFLDFDLRTAFGSRRSSLYKRVKFNRFNFVGFMADEFLAGVAVVDLGLIKNGFAYHFDRKTGVLTETSVLTPFRATIRPTPDTPMSRINTSSLALTISETGVDCRTDTFSLKAEFTAPHPAPLRVASRTGYRGWTYTDKRSPVSVKGTFSVNGTTTEIASPHVLALTDWSAGYMRRNTFWSWASSAAVLADGRPFGMNLAAGVNETGFTENMIWIDGAPVHIGPVHFDYRDNDTTTPWRITSMDGIIDLTFTPEGHREEKVNALVMGSLFTQLCGSFTGTVTPPGADPVPVTNAPGFCEDHFARW